VAYLVAPLPLERHGDFEQNGDDPREVDVTDDLEGGGGRSQSITPGSACGKVMQCMSRVLCVVCLCVCGG